MLPIFLGARSGGKRVDIRIAVSGCYLTRTIKARLEYQLLHASRNRNHHSCEALQSTTLKQRF